MSLALTEGSYGVGESPLGLGNGDPRIEAIRAQYRDMGMWRAKDQRLTARERDILGVLRTAGEPLTGKDLYFIFDAIPRVWVGHAASDMMVVLNRLHGKGLVEKLSRQWTGTEPRFEWRVRPELVEFERRLAPTRSANLPGVGHVTGSRRRRRKFKTTPRQCGGCGARFHSIRPKRFCSDPCSRLGENKELAELLAAQERDAQFGTLVRHAWMSSLEEPMRLKRDPHSECGCLLDYLEDES